MAVTTGMLIWLVTLTGQLVHSKVITINSASSNTSPECCTEEGCMCGSLSTALQYIDNNDTIINITSESVALNNTTTMGSGKLTNITITGSNVTIMCNNSGSVYCESCDDVRIEGITWDRCGDPNGTNIAGVTFNGTSNISLVNCTFQHSQIKAVSLLDISGNFNIIHCNFLSNKGIQLPLQSNCGGLSIFSGSVFVNLIISNSYFYDNGFHCDGYAGLILSVTDYTGLTMWNVTITKTMFFSNMGGVFFEIYGASFVELDKLMFTNNIAACSSVAGIDFVFFGNSSLLVSNSIFTNNIGSALLWFIEGEDKTEILISNSNFTNTSSQLEFDNDNSAVATIQLLSSGHNSVLITLVDVEISHSWILAASADYSENGGSASLYIGFLDADIMYAVEINLTRVRLMSNTYLKNTGGAVYIQYSNYISQSNLTIEECEFFNNTSLRGAALCIEKYSYKESTFTIIASKIYQNTADDSVIYIDSKSPQNIITVIVKLCNFTNNIGSSIHLLECNLFCENVTFANNSADNGAALYIDQGTFVTFDEGGTTQFINNSAVEHGGAVYIYLVYNCFSPPFSYNDSSVVLFVNNTAKISGSSLYFYVPAHCKVERNISKPSSILYVPCQFNYTQSINGKMMNIPCDLDYTLLNGTGAPIVTSPHELRLYFPFNDGYNMSSTSDHNVYFIANNILGHPVKFTAATFGYFGKPAEPTQFNIKCTDCVSSIVLSKLTVLVDNATSLSVTFSGTNIKKRLNYTVILISAVHSIKEISSRLVVELLPCIDHPGYTYSAANKICVCYQYNVDCHDNYNEIKRGYWFGSVMEKTTTSLCPNHYCEVIGHKETRQGYLKLPNTINAQCNHHRVGIACGECSSGYTLLYDSTDCISVDQCGSGWTVLVILLTCLYWITVVAGVFSLMYFKHHISLGYLHGIIYYYSMVGVLLDNNPFISDGIFQFISVLSSFAQLTPQFLGKLCFVKGLSGIDQLFIHYSHAVAVSLLLLLIVVAARCSARITLFVSRCIIRVICLLILLSYTSIVSTSLQLLRPLKFTNVKEWYTYSSPHIQYFHGRHAVYVSWQYFVNWLLELLYPCYCCLNQF